MCQSDVLIPHWTLFFILGLLNKYILVWSKETIPLDQASSKPTYLFRYWSDWSTWSVCSRTCGGGIRMKTRICKIRSLGYIASPNTCMGETVEYEICSRHNCSPYEEEFLSYQCSQHNGQVVAGKKITEWVPHYNGKNPCELQCWSSGRTLMYSFGKVIDGTSCQPVDPMESALCVNGRCMSVDCAGYIGTDNRRDMCGVCRGSNSTCVKHQNVFWKRSRTKSNYGGLKDHHYDYNEITRIPAGATHVRVKEESENNFLVLIDNKGNYHINGNWRIQSPGRFVVHGSEFTYNRTWDGQEVISASGPTRVDVFIYVLGLDDIPTVYYEYWTSSSNPRQSFNSLVSLSQIKSAGNFEKVNTVQKISNPLNDIIETKLHPKSINLPDTKFHGYKSYYHRNEILKSVPSWSVKRRRNYKYNLFNPTNATSIPVIKNSQKSVVANHAENKNIATLTPVPATSKNFSYSNEFRPTDVSVKNFNSSWKIMHFPTPWNSLNTSDSVKLIHTLHNHFEHSSELKLVPIIRNKFNTSGELISSTNSRNNFNKTTPQVNLPKRNKNRDQFFDEFGRPNGTSAHTRATSVNSIYSPRKKKRKSLETHHQKRAHKDRGRRRSSPMKDSSMKGECAPCAKVKRQTMNFCTKEFVLRALVLAKEKLLRSIRYEIQVIQSYKNTVPISTREYLWTTDSCQCPKLRTGKEYILMGHSSTSGNQRESRLLIGRNSFVRKYNQKRARTLMRLARDQVSLCSENK